jgi:hypothetical protein
MERGKYKRLESSCLGGLDGPGNFLGLGIRLKLAPSQHDDVVHRKADTLHAFKYGTGDGLRTRCQSLRGCKKSEGREEGGGGGKTLVHKVLRSQGGLVEEAHVLGHIRAGCPVVTRKEVLNHRGVVGGGIGENLGDDVHLQLVHVPTCAAVRALLKHATHAVLDEKAGIWAQDKPVGEGHDVVGKIGDVVPNIEPVADLAPGNNVGLKLRSQKWRGGVDFKKRRSG